MHEWPCWCNYFNELHDNRCLKVLQFIYDVIKLRLINQQDEDIKTIFQHHSSFWNRINFSQCTRTSSYLWGHRHTTDARTKLRIFHVNTRGEFHSHAVKQINLLAFSTTRPFIILYVAVFMMCRIVCQWLNNTIVPQCLWRIGKGVPLFSLYYSCDR